MFRRGLVVLAVCLHCLAFEKLVIVRPFLRRYVLVVGCSSALHGHSAKGRLKRSEFWYILYTLFRYCVQMIQPVFSVFVYFISYWSYSQFCPNVFILNMIQCSADFNAILKRIT
jgi:hypothetical protein